ncbi:hypothetical protein [Priestia endophytica]|uniref:hypothetical protein n=1 Tax=Priestia endophytica TaxID=135735 RepID=UPI0018CE1D17|nr:hypothetical protein [Priestia endophytica]
MKDQKGSKTTKEIHEKIVKRSLRFEKPSEEKLDQLDQILGLTKETRVVDKDK